MTGLLGLQENHGTKSALWKNCGKIAALNIRSYYSHRSHHLAEQFCDCPPVIVAHTRLPSIGFRSWSRFLAVSLQVTWVINPAVGCHYFSPGPQLPPQHLGEGYYQFRCLVNSGMMGVNSLPKTVTRQRRNCDLNLGLLRLSPAR